VPSRTWVYWSSLALSISGWGGALLSWFVLGNGAGADARFILAAGVGITSTIVWSMCVVLPDLARVYGIGHRDGMAAGRALATAPPPTGGRRLSIAP
jgi:hypothetical protein